jgi:hypothetical protein
MMQTYRVELDRVEYQRVSYLVSAETKEKALVEWETGDWTDQADITVVNAEETLVGAFEIEEEE